MQLDNDSALVYTLVQSLHTADKNTIRCLCEVYEDFSDTNKDEEFATLGGIRIITEVESAACKNDGTALQGLHVEAWLPNP